MGDELSDPTIIPLNQRCRTQKKGILAGTPASVSCFQSFCIFIFLIDNKSKKKKQSSKIFLIQASVFEVALFFYISYEADTTLYAATGHRVPEDKLDMCMPFNKQRAVYGNYMHLCC